MLTHAGTIASWEEDRLFSEPQFSDQGSIATELHPQANSAWDDCVDALLKLLSVGPWHLEEQFGEAPSRAAIKKSLSWLSRLKGQSPLAPPTCIVVDPEGGIIVERRDRDAAGRDRLRSITFKNDDSIEVVLFLDGRVAEIMTIPKSNLAR